MHGWWAASYLVLWLLVIVLVVIVVALARQIGNLHTQLGPRVSVGSDDEGPPLGWAPPAINLLDINGSPVTLGGPGPQQLLLFMSPGCDSCEQILEALPALARNGQLSPYVITDVYPTEAELAFGDRNLAAPIVSAPGVVQRYQVPGTPYAVVADRLGTLRAKGPLVSLEQVERLIDTARSAATAAATGIQAG